MEKAYKITKSFTIIHKLNFIKVVLLNRIEMLIIQIRRIIDKNDIFWPIIPASKMKTNIYVC